MFHRSLLAPLQASVVDSVLLAVLHGLTVVAFLAISLATVSLLVGALRAEHGRLRDREARIILVAAGVLFVAGFARLVVTDGVPNESLAGVALGFAAVAYLLSLARPALFDLSGEGETARDVDTEPAR
jgi:hypothetical protein